MGNEKQRGYSRVRKAGWASLLGLAATVPAAAAEPAVSSPNLTVMAVGALFDKDHFGPDSFGAVGIKGAIPVGNAFGFQGDAAIGTNGYYGVGGHFFTRDPSVGLLGVFASYEKNDFGSITRYGAEGSLYWNNLTVDALAGYQTSSSDGNGFAGKLDLSFYLTPDFKLTGGVATDPGATFGHAALEWQPTAWGRSGLSFFVDGRFGDASRNRVMAGVNFRFGGKGKSLIDRDRRDDPFFLLFNNPSANDAPAFTPPPKDKG